MYLSVCVCVRVCVCVTAHWPDYWTQMMSVMIDTTSSLRCSDYSHHHHQQQQQQQQQELLGQLCAALWCHLDCLTCTLLNIFNCV